MSAPAPAILIVDDDLFIRKLIATTLEDISGYRLQEAGDGLEAVEDRSGGLIRYALLAQRRRQFGPRSSPLIKQPEADDPSHRFRVVHRLVFRRVERRLAGRPIPRGSAHAHASER